MIIVKEHYEILHAWLIVCNWTFRSSSRCKCWTRAKSQTTSSGLVWGRRSLTTRRQPSWKIPGQLKGTSPGQLKGTQQVSIKGAIQVSLKGQNRSELKGTTRSHKGITQVSLKGQQQVSIKGGTQVSLKGQHQVSWKGNYDMFSSKGHHHWLVICMPLGMLKKTSRAKKEIADKKLIH